MAKNEENVNNFFMKMKENEKFGLKLDIQTTKILISGPIPAQQMDGETMEIPRHFILGGSKIIADCDFCHEIKRHLVLG